jgi:hypothetical protein
MCRIALVAMLVALASDLAAPEAVACRHRRARWQACCPCMYEASCTYEATSRGIAFNTANCMGGTGTYSAPDTKVTGAFLKDQGVAGTSYQCQLTVTDRGSWTATCGSVPKGTYKLGVTGNVSGTTYSSSFSCP